ALASWGWWFSTQGVLGFLIPVLCLVFIFKRKPGEIGLGLGDWKLALGLSALYIPLVVVGTFVLSADPAFQANYPHLRSAASSWKVFAIYESLFIFYWFGWEYLWRGYMLFGTERTFGAYAILIQAIPFALLHAGKPFIEGMLSVVGGIALGALVWRCRLFWIAIPIHAAQMLILDFFCSLRVRTGATGLGLSDLIEMLGGM
ncbi:MAG: CPBP family intramembrane metalloprotease, partial [Rhodothermales bacterium]|nr:CPBP family intramembrane metalloprotease [Rhodothermales bacterium]